MRTIRIEIGSPLHNAALRYDDHFGDMPGSLDDCYYGPKTDEELIEEIDRCIRDNEEFDLWFGFTEEEKLAELNMPLYDPPPKSAQTH